MPAALVTTVGNPIPDRLTLTSPLTTEAVLGVLACVAWVLWAQFVACLAVEAIAEVRLATGHSADWLARVPGTLGAQQALARTLVQAVIAIGVAASATTAANPWIDQAAAATSASVVLPDTAPRPNPRTEEIPSPKQVASTTITVQRGDTLWSIAEQHLGAGERWREIAEVNRGQQMADGSTFDDSRTVQPGWTLRVPSGGQRQEAAVVVEPGDTLWGIAKEEYGEGADWPRIYRANRSRIDDPHWIYPGQHFEVPGHQVQAPPEVDQGPADLQSEHNPPPDRVPPLEPAPETIAPPDGAVVDEPTAEEPAEVADDSAIQIDGATITRALLCGGGFLAAGMLAVYVGRRRTQSRNRRSGRSAPSVGKALRAEDKALRAVGGAAGERTAFFDAALRELAQLTEDRGGALPDVAAARIGDDGLHLYLACVASDAPAPWSSSDGGLVWSLPLMHVAGATDRMSPYPSMVTLGEDDNGDTLLVDLEAAGVTQIIGEQVATVDLARFIAAELAINPWADAEIVSLVGIGDEVAPLSYGRLFVEPHVDIERLTKVAHQMVDNIESSGRDVLASRVVDWMDAWVPTVTIGSLAGEDLDGIGPATAELLDEMERTSTRTAVVLVTVGTIGLDPRALTLRLDADDRLQTPWGVVTPNRLTAEEATTLAELFDDAENEDNEPIPVAQGPDGEPGEVNEAGALVADLTEDRCGTGDPHSVLPRPDRAYVEAAATTIEDLAALAPAVSPDDSARIIASDPNLDDDLDEWGDPDSSRPKLTVLGPVELHAVGEKSAEVDSRPAYFAELAAYLTAHPAGRTPNEVAADFGIQNNTLHTRLGQLRKWLGKRPDIDEWYLPNAVRVRGQQVYRIHGVLVDADLFRRLRSRAEARGPSGIDDLKQALELVVGMPYDQPRKRGYGWLSDTPFDHYLTAAVVDVAHIVATHALTEGQPKIALWASEKAIAAAPSEDRPRLDLARAMQMMGDDAEAERYLRHEVFNRTDDDRPPLEPSARTKQVGDRIEQHDDL
ncbi:MULTISPECIES: LysM peptidoglycan-binding domain-containing protein [unclassified Nocardioides]|uniref:LysM peptidoglycan-binding domain-containing protein n=1 Tax=unclassified Nocardioides TaxID=2615069 RepID=UPI00138F61EB|nr:MULTISPECIES: LysM peptidoglycan-binding domain-containing protein [unclassified Nocardioides]